MKKTYKFIGLAVLAAALAACGQQEGTTAKVQENYVQDFNSTDAFVKRFTDKDSFNFNDALPFPGKFNALLNKFSAGSRLLAGEDEGKEAELKLGKLYVDTAETFKAIVSDYAKTRNEKAQQDFFSNHNVQVNWDRPSFDTALTQYVDACEKNQYWPINLEVVKQRLVAKDAEGKTIDFPQDQAQLIQSWNANIKNSCVVAKKLLDFSKKEGFDYNKLKATLEAATTTAPAAPQK